MDPCYKDCALVSEGTDIHPARMLLVIYSMYGLRFLKFDGPAHGERSVTVSLLSISSFNISVTWIFFFAKFPFGQGE